MSLPHLLVFGSGSLAGEIVRSLVGHVPQVGKAALRVTIASRSPAQARWVAAVAMAHADALGRSTRIETTAHNWSTVATTAALIDAMAPDLVLHTASLQSAWSLAEDNRWSRFVVSCGYGVTTPLQLVLARHIQQAIAGSRHRPRWINGCYPDLVNAGLALTGEPPLCGIGNVAILAEHVRLQNGLDRHAPVRLIAGHADIATFQRPRRAEEALPAAWLGDDRIEPDRLAALDALPSGTALNAFNAAEAARLIWAVLSEQPIRTHVPGPLGLVGGYPIEFDGRGLSLDLPSEIDQQCAFTLNRQAMIRDGAMIDTEGGVVRFGQAGRDALAGDAPGLADGFRVNAVESAVREMMAVRQSWHAQA